MTTLTASIPSHYIMLTTIWFVFISISSIFVFVISQFFETRVAMMRRDVLNVLNVVANCRLIISYFYQKHNKRRRKQANKFLGIAADLY